MNKIKMIVTTGDGKIIRGLDKEGVIAELKLAQKRGDRFASVTGARVAGYNPEDLEKEAGYTIGAKKI